MAYIWKKEFETGNTTIDSQHKELINAINSLLEACSAGKGREEIKNTSNFLVDYTSRHFADEERLQLASKYPDYVNHKRYHEGFKKVTRDIALELDRDGATIVSVGKVNSAIAGWLINHITKEDVKVAEHIKAQK